MSFSRNIPCTDGYDLEPTFGDERGIGIDDFSKILLESAVHKLNSDGRMKEGGMNLRTSEIPITFGDPVEQDVLHES
jgi:hypothetical protein